jgi:hypothetical protein
MAKSTRTSRSMPGTTCGGSLEHSSPPQPGCDLHHSRLWQWLMLCDCYNIGIATGPSGLLVVDLDRPKNPTDLPPEPWRSRGCATGADVLAWLATEQTAPCRTRPPSQRRVLSTGPEPISTMSATSVTLSVLCR